MCLKSPLTPGFLLFNFRLTLSGNFTYYCFSEMKHFVFCALPAALLCNHGSVCVFSASCPSILCSSVRVQTAAACVSFCFSPGLLILAVMETGRSGPEQTEAAYTGP